jgi:hypothetical protein
MPLLLLTKENTMNSMKTRLRGASAPVPIPVRRSSETAIRFLPDADLEELRRALRRTLRELTLGSPASQLVGRLIRLVRAEQRRRERQRRGRPCAA